MFCECLEIIVYIKEKTLSGGIILLIVKFKHQQNQSQRSKLNYKRYTLTLFLTAWIHCSYFQWWPDIWESTELSEADSSLMDRAVVVWLEGGM